MERVMDAERTALCFDVEIEHLSRRRLERLQEIALAHLIQRARQAPFFADRLTALGAVGDRLPVAQFREAVPLTTKADLRQARDAAWAQGYREQIVLMLGTSGTTGTRVALPYTAHDVHCWRSLAARTLWTNGLRPGDPVLLPVPLGLFTGGHGMFGGLQALGCRTVPLGAATTPVMAEALRGAFGDPPVGIVTLPSHMLRLLESLPEAGLDPAACGLHIGSFGAEAWTEAARARIEEGFGLYAADSYGIGEICGPGIAAECAHRTGMHVWEDAFLVEIVDANGQPVPDGTPGELVLTPLFREALPLLRYRTGDEAALLPDPCPCGRTHRRISRIARRVDDVLVVTGVNVDPADIERLLYAVPWLGAEFYLRAEDGVLQVHIERRGACPPDANEQLVAMIRRDFPVRVHVTLYEAGQLERTPGKARRIR
jgi:phenylacetate-CoA ligase